MVMTRVQHRAGPGAAKSHSKTHKRGRGRPRKATGDLKKPRRGVCSSGKSRSTVHGKSRCRKSCPNGRSKKTGVCFTKRCGPTAMGSARARSHKTGRCVLE